MLAAEVILFPHDANVLNVRSAPYSAAGDGLTDDTAAIQAALEDAAKGMGTLIYLPHGTYLISDTLRWQGRQTRHVLQGESREGTTVRLADAAPGFTDPENPKEMIWTGEFPPQRFRNAIRNLTIDAGQKNPGAIGARFNASNQGQMRHVTIRSGDGSGAIGLDMSYTGDVGPLLVRNLTVVGFDVGIATAHGSAGQALEHIRLSGQRRYGWVNRGQAVSVRRLESENRVPAIHNEGKGGVFTLIDSRLHGEGDAKAGAAIENHGGLILRDVEVSGYRAAVSAPGMDAPVPAGLVEEYTSQPVQTLFDSPARSLRLPVEEVPDVPWGDASDPADWVNITRYTPVKGRFTVKERHEDGQIVEVEKELYDWTAAIQQAIDEGAKTIYFPRGNPTGEPYEVLGTVHLRNRLQRLIGLENAFGKAGAGVFQLDDGDAPVVIIERFDWIYTPITIRSASPRTLVVSAIPGAHYDIGPGSTVFIEDVVTEFQMGKGSRVWIRQFNTEYTNEVRRHVVDPATMIPVPLLPPGDQLPSDGGPAALERLTTAPGSVNDGGDLWVLGIKTEGDGTILTTINGGRSEILGGLIYANKAYYPAKRAFVVKDSSFFLAAREAVLRKQPFNMVAEIRDGEARISEPGGHFHLFRLGPETPPPKP